MNSVDQAIASLVADGTIQPSDRTNFRNHVK
jgi:hypothetical protein